MSKPAWQQTSIYLTVEDRQMMDELQEETKLGRSALVRLALQRMYYGEDRDRQARLLAIAEEIKRIA
jgi:hypothetical protein